MGLLSVRSWEDECNTSGMGKVGLLPVRSQEAECNTRGWGKLDSYLYAVEKMRMANDVIRALRGVHIVEERSG